MTKFYTLKSIVISFLTATTLLVASSVAYAQAPVNDACSGAIAVTPGAAAMSGTNVAATNTGEPTLAGCATTITASASTVWYQFTPTSSGNVTVTLVCFAPVRGFVQGFCGASCSSLSVVGCGYATAAAGTTSMAMGVVAGTTYYLRVGGTNAQVGTFTIAISSPTVPTGTPANDNCANPVTLVINAAPTPVNNRTATAEPCEPYPACWVNGVAPKTVWYQFTTTTAGTYTIATTSLIATNTQLALYSGTCGARTEVACAEFGLGGSGAQAVIQTSTLLPNTTYLVQASGGGSVVTGPTEDFSIAVSLADAAPTPSSNCLVNDSCINATNIPLGPNCVPGCNTGATREANEPANPACWATGGPTNKNTTVWYKFTTAAAGSYIISTSNAQTSNTNTEFDVYSGSCGAFTFVGCAQFGLQGAGAFAALQIDLAGTTTYYVRVNANPFLVGGAPTDGQFCISVNAAPGGSAPANCLVNDNCANAIELVPDALCTIGCNTGATVETGERTDPDCWDQGIPAGSTSTVPVPDPANNTVWYKFTTVQSGNYVITTNNPSSPTTYEYPDDTKLKLFDACGSQNVIACNDESAADLFKNHAVIMVELPAGSTYYIQVDKVASTTGSFCISVNFVPGEDSDVVPNDLCDGAKTIIVDAPCTNPPNGNNTGATFSNNAKDPNPGCFDPDDTGAFPDATVWFKFTTGVAGDYSVIAGEVDSNVTGLPVVNGIDMQIALWSGQCGSFTLLGCSESGSIETITRALAANTTYFVQADQYLAEQGPFCIRVAGPANSGPINDCIANAIDITNDLNSISPTNNPFVCKQYRYASTGVTGAPTPSTIASDNATCDPTTDRVRQDVWYKFTVTAATPSAWIDVYEYNGAIKGDYVAALYSGPPSFDSTCKNKTITGLTYMDCSGGVNAANGNDFGGTRDKSRCSATFPRIDISTLAPGTYYYRVWYRSATPGQDITVPLPVGAFTFTNGNAVNNYAFGEVVDLSLCIESSVSDPVSVDSCSQINSTNLLSANQGCFTLPNFNYSPAFTNLNTAGKMGKRICAGGQEPNKINGVAIGDASANCSGTFAPATIAATDTTATDTIRYTNTSLYAFDIAPCTSNLALATLKFDNLVLGGLVDRGIRVQVIKDNCVTTAKAAVVMRGSYVPSGTTGGCYQLRDTLSAGRYYVIVEGMDGQLLKYDLSLDVKYDIGTQVASHRPVAKFAPAVLKSRYCVNENITFNFTGDLGFGSSSTTSPVCANNTPIAYAWTVANGTIVSGQNTPTLVVRKSGTAGTMNIKLKVISSGCESTEVDTNIIIFRPVSDFTMPAFVCENQAATISYNVAPIPASTLFDWNFGLNASPATLTGGVAAAAGPHQISWSTASIKIVRLFVTEDGCRSDTTSKTIDVKARPLTAYTMPLTACVNTPVNITGPTGASWLWDFKEELLNETGADPEQSTVKDPTVQWNTPGDKTVVVEVTSAEGCKATSLPRTITISAKPEVTITVNEADNDYCRGQIATLTAIATPAGSLAGNTLTWNFGPTATPVTMVGNPVTASWSAVTDTQRVTLTVTGSCANLTATKLLKINALPTPTFTVNDASACFDQQVTFTPNQNTFQSYSWNFGIGGSEANSGTGAAPRVVTWSSTGLKTTNLTVTDGNGCASTSPNVPVTVGSKIIATFALVSPLTCGAANGSLTANAGAGITYQWLGTPTPPAGPTYSNRAAGSYTLQMTRTADACAIDTTVSLNDPNAPTVTVAGTAPKCNGASDGTISATASLGTAPYSFSISPVVGTVAGTGPNRTFSNLPANNYAITVQDNVGCKGTAQVDLNDPSKLVVDLGADRSAVPGETVTLNTTVVGGKPTYDYLWSTGAMSTSINVVVTKDTTITVRVTDDNDCVDTDTIVISVCTAVVPVISISADTVCGGNAVTVSAQTIAGAIYEWEFEDNNSEANKSGIFNLSWANRGNKEISVVIRVNGCPSARVKDSVEVITISDPQITSSGNNCQESFIDFDLVSGTNSYNTYLWSFGSDATPQTSTKLDPELVRWSVAGDKTISVDVSNAYCPAKTGQLTIKINPYPTVSVIAPTEICQGKLATIDIVTDANIGTRNFSVVVPPDVVNQISAKRFEIVWNTAGQKNISVNVSDPVTGCATPTGPLASVNVLASPDASFAMPKEACVGDGIELEYLGNEDLIDTYDWTYGSAATPTTGTTVDPESPVYNTAGSYIISLVVTDNFGCVSKPFDSTVVIKDLPSNQFSFKTATLCEGAVDTITAAFVPALGETVVYTWTLGDGTNISGTDIEKGRKIAVVWNNPGTKDVTLSVTRTREENGELLSQCSSSARTKQIEIVPTPVADFTSQGSGCVGQDVTVTFTGVASDAALFTWDFGGSTGGAPGVRGPQNLKFASEGTKLIKLFVTEAGCRSGDKEQGIIVNTRPVAGIVLSDDSICFGDEVTVNFNGTTQDSTTARFKWDFGKDNSIVDVGGEAGVYTITWTSGNTKTISLVVEENGCLSDTVKETVYVTPELVLVTSNPQQAFPCGADNGTAKVDVQPGPASAYTYSWNTVPLQETQTATGLSAGTYEVTVTPRGTPECPQSALAAVSDRDAPLATVKKSDVLCNGQNSGTATVTPTGGAGDYTYVWSDGQETQTAVGLVAGNYSCVVRDADNCRRTVLVTINEPEPLFVAITGNQQICGGSSGMLTAEVDGGTPGYTYFWSTSDTTKTITVSPTATTTYTVEIEDKNGCVATDDLEVEVLPAPVASFSFSSQTACSRNDVIITFTGTALVGTPLDWNFGDDAQIIMQSADKRTNTIRWNSAGTKEVTLDISQGSCNAPTEKKKIVINPSKDPNFTVAASSCVGKELTVTYTGDATNAAIFDWNNFDGANVVSGTKKGPYTISYNAIGVKTVTLVVTEDGCSSLFSRTVDVKAAPTSNFVIGSACLNQGAVVTYTGNASPAATYQWNFDNGAANPGGIQQGPHDVTWITEGAKYVTLKVSEGGCSSATTTVATLVRPVPTAIISLDEEEPCFGESIVVNYGATPSTTATYDWNFGTGAQVLSGNNSGPYEVKWNSAGIKQIVLTVTEDGCSATATSDPINVQPKLTLTPTVVKPACGASNGSLTVVPAGGVTGSPAYSIDFYGDSPAIKKGDIAAPYDITGIPSGVYRVVVADTKSSSGCFADTLFAVNDNYMPITTVTATVTQPNCAIDDGTIDITTNPPLDPGVDADYEWYKITPINNRVLLAEDSSQLADVSAGTYYVEIRPYAAPGTCKLFQTAEIIAPAPVIVNAGGDVEICTGNSVSFSPAVTGGKGALEYALFDVGTGLEIPGYNFTDNLTLPIVVPNLTKDTAFYIGVRDSLFCFGFDSVSVIVKTPPLTSFTTSTDTVCFDKVVTITYDGESGVGSAYTWSFDKADIVSGSKRGPFDVKWKSPGDKTITLSVLDSATGCTITASPKSVHVTTIPNAAFTVSNNIACEGQVLTFTYAGNDVNNDYTYDWRFVGSSLPAATTVGPHLVSWSTASTRQATLLVTNKNGCRSAPLTSQPITVRATPSDLFTVETPVCVGIQSTIRYQGTMPPDNQYEWNGFAGGRIVSGTDAGPYEITWPTSGTKNVTLTVTRLGCSSAPARVVPVTVNDKPIIAIRLASPTVCQNDTAVVEYNGSLIPGATYVWNFDGANVVSGDPVGPGPIGLKWPSSGDKKVRLKVLSNGCTSDEARATVSVITKPLGPKVQPVTICQNAPAGSVPPLTATPSSGGSLRWFNDATGGTGSTTAPTPSTARTDTFFVSQIVGSAACESDRVPLIVTIQAPDNAAFSYASGGIAITDQFCINDPNGVLLATPVISGGVYTVVPATGLSLTRATGAIDTRRSTPRATAYTITYTTPAGAKKCPNTSEVKLVALAPADASFRYTNATQTTGGNIFEFCSDVDTALAELGINTLAGGTFKVFGDNDLMGLNPQTGAIDMFTFPPTTYDRALSTYTIAYEVTDGVCPAALIPATVIINKTPTAKIVAAGGCVNAPIEINYRPVDGIKLPAGSRFVWTFSDTIVNTTSATLDKPAVWETQGKKPVSLVLTTPAGCSVRVDTTLSIEAVPIATFTTDRDTLPYIINIGQIEPVQFFPDVSNYGFGNYIWNFGDFTVDSIEQQPFHQFTEVRDHYVTLTTRIGECERSFDTLVARVVDTREIFVPNAFSPNGDGKNEILQFFPIGMKSATIEIYNRWGQVVYTGTEKDAGWDGTFKGVEISEGVYVYIVRGRTIANRLKEVKGYITLVR